MRQFHKLIECNMKYAVVRFSGRQYKVSEGDEVLFDKLDSKDLPAGRQEAIKLSDVLLVADDGEAKIGTPTVAGSFVEAKVLGSEKGEKIDVVKFKAKARYRRHTGFRPQYTRVKIDSISISK